MLKTINDSHIFSDPSSSFLMSAAIDDCINKSDKATFISSVRNLKNKSNEKKVNLKKELFKDHDMKEAFRESLINCTQFYKENIPDSTDNIYKKSLFFNNNVSIIKLIINI